MRHYFTTSKKGTRKPRIQDLTRKIVALLRLSALLATEIGLLLVAVKGVFDAI